MEGTPILTITISAGGKPPMPPGRDIAEPIGDDMGGDSLDMSDPGQDMAAEKDMVSPVRVASARDLVSGRGGPGGPKPRGL